MLKMLDHFDDMWDGHLGPMKAVRHRIEFRSPEVRPIYSAPYIAVPKGLVFEKEGLD